MTLRPSRLLTISRANSHRAENNAGFALFYLISWRQLSW